jgi:hypothetical protein
MSGNNDTVLSLTVFDDGNGPALYAGGAFEVAGGVPASRVAKWNGSTWAPLGLGLGFNSEAFALAVFDDGNGPILFVGGGQITTAGGVFAPGLVRWDGSSWSGVGYGVGNRGLSDVIKTLAVFDDGRGPALYAGGAFAVAGVPIGTPDHRIARWDGSDWEIVDELSNEVNALAVLDDGSGSALYAAGMFQSAGGVPGTRRIARRDGSSWKALGSGIGATLAGSGDRVNCLTIFDDGSGPALFAGGNFSTASGVNARRIAKWDGAAWSSLNSNMGGEVSAMAVFDDGGGPALYVAGSFTTAGTVTANGIAKWDGSSWSALGSGMDLPVHALAVFDDGDGPALYAGGRFTTAGGVAATCIAKWNGSSWAPLGAGVGGSAALRVSSLAVLDDSTGPVLYAGGDFTTAGGVAANRIAKWDGTSWSALGGGMGGNQFVPTPLEVRSLAVFNDRTGLSLFAGGNFQVAFDSGDSYLAKWGRPDTTTPVITCPASIVIDDRPGTPPGEIVTYSVVAKDEQDPTPTLVCEPPSGSHFPRGTTLVTCTVTDFTGNQTSCEFTITVGAKPPKHFPAPSPH